MKYFRHIFLYANAILWVVDTLALALGFQETTGVATAIAYAGFSITLAILLKDEK